MCDIICVPGNITAPMNGEGSENLEEILRKNDIVTDIYFIGGKPLYKFNLMNFIDYLSFRDPAAYK